MIRSILHPDNAAALRDAARGSLLLAFDYDGTLAPITARPADAVMRPGTRRLLAQVSRLYPTAIVSGRAVADLAPRVDGAILVALVGNHGHEWGGKRPPGHVEVQRWYMELAAALAGVPGILVEDKGVSLSVHWRAARDHKAARDRVMTEVGRLVPRARVVGGKAVANVMPDDGLTKGSAVVQLMRECQSSRALYVGDDETDEDVFALPPSQGVIGVHVGRMASSGATYRLPSQRHIDVLLQRLIAWREPGGS